LSYKISQANDGCRDCGAFFLDIVGAFRRQDVAVRLSPAQRTTCPEVEQVIEQTWKKELALAQLSGRRLYDGKLYRLIEAEAQGKELTLTVGPVSFKEFLGTNSSNAYLRYRHGMEVMANPIGVSASVVSSDGFLVLGRRSDQVTNHAGMIHPVGGMVESADNTPLPDLFGICLQELREEVGLTDQVGNVLCLGLVRDKQLCQPEFIFDVSVSADARTIRTLATSAEDAHEHTELLAVRDQPSSVVNFIEHHCRETTPVALATLLLHGLHNWGSGWFVTAQGYLRNII
jgi:8-oxo-dGTP pyrophosphatase MutT (NUDIX family)